MTTLSTFAPSTRARSRSEANDPSVKTTLEPESLSTYASSEGAKRMFRGLMMPAPNIAAWYSSMYSWLLAASTAKRSPGSKAEHGSHRIGQSHEAINVDFERALIVGACARHVDKRDLVRELLGALQQESGIHEFLHAEAGVRTYVSGPIGTTDLLPRVGGLSLEVS